MKQSNCHLVEPHLLTGYDWGDVNWVYHRFKKTKFLHTFLKRIKKEHPDANSRDMIIMWQVFDFCECEKEKHEKRNND
jgi:hypothetical protein